MFYRKPCPRHGLVHQLIPCYMFDRLEETMLRMIREPWEARLKPVGRK